MIDLGNLGKKKEEKAQTNANATYIAVGQAPVKSNFTPVSNMSCK